MKPWQLKHWRLSRKMTQVEAAAWAGVSLRSWRRYEHRNVPVWLQNRILDHLWDEGDFNEQAD